MKKNLTLFLFLCIHILNYAQTPGTLDATFGANGRATTPISPGSDFANAIVVQADNKIIVAGRYQQKPPMGTIFIDTVHVQLVRYNPNGTIDATFGVNGRVATTPENSDAWALAQQTDGKILLAGYSGLEGFMVIRYNTNGSLDSTFNNNGIVKGFFGASTNMVAYLHAITLQSDGKILITGRTGSFIGADRSVALARLNTNGSFDESFGNQGRIIKVINAAKSVDIRAISLQTDNKILICGYQFVNVFGNITQKDMIVLRYKSSGVIDSSFANNGIYVLPNHDAFSVKALSNGKIVVAGSVDIDTTLETKAFALFQFNANGSLDNSFGTNGKVVTQAQNGCFATDMIVQKDNKILLAGPGRDDFNNLDFVMVRYNTTGSLDNTFGVSGQSIITATDYWLGYFRMALQNDGKIVVSHTYSRSNKYNFVVSRYNNNIAGVGVNQLNEKPVTLVIYPNPVSDLLALKSNRKKAGQVDVYDSVGKLILSKKVSVDEDFIDVSALKNGLYLLKLSVENEFSNASFFKN